MARVIVSNDWKSITFSKKLKNELWLREDLDDNHGSWRTDERVIRAIIKLQGESFDELHDGVQIVEYDENKCHPVIDEEEYGGEILHFEEGKGDIEWGYAYSYNPMSGECDDDTPYDFVTDKFQTSKSDVQGSRQLAEKIVSYCNGYKKEILNKLMKYSSCRLYDIEKAMILQTDEQLNAYFHIFVSCPNDFINRDNIHIWAMMYTREQIIEMYEKFRFAQTTLKTKVEPYMELLKSI